MEKHFLLLQTTKWTLFINSVSVEIRPFSRGNWIINRREFGEAWLWRRGDRQVDSNRCSFLFLNSAVWFRQVTTTSDRTDTDLKKKQNFRLLRQLVVEGSCRRRVRAVRIREVKTALMWMFMTSWTTNLLFGVIINATCVMLRYEDNLLIKENKSPKCPICLHVYITDKQTNKALSWSMLSLTSRPFTTVQR